MASVANPQAPPLRRLDVTVHSCTHDAQWLSGLYESTFDAAYRLAVVLTRDRDLAEDVVAEAFLRTWAARDRFDPNRPALPWILSITRNCAMDALRSRRLHVDIDSIAEPSSDDDTAGMRGLDEDQLRALADGVARLTDEQQQVVLLRFYQGLPHQAIAERLGKNPNAVRAIQFRALAQLRKHLEAHHV
jgi:RNA polymerase sigma-70 factor (ECF subfamily)